MKPEKLIICGWGPYKEETQIDFTKFNRQLFLITGQTGAGKTTIFDAIAYALYGILSGQVREKGTVRSDFALETTKTYVELYMTHKSEKYHIIRNPEYLRPTKKKNAERAFTKERENAALTLPDGSIIAGNQEVTRKVEEILGMDGRQFCQISMIAQGEFSKLLFASPNEKTAIFRELFQTGIYASVQSKLKERAAGLYKEYMKYTSKMDEDIHLLSFADVTFEAMKQVDPLDYDAVKNYLWETKKALSQKRKKEEAMQKCQEKEVLEQKEELERTRQVNARFLELRENQKKREQLMQKQEAMTLLAKKIETGKAARIFALEEKVILQKEQEVKQLEHKLALSQKEVKQLLAKIKDASIWAAKKEAIREAYDLQEQIQEVSAQCEEQKQEKNKLTKCLEKAREEYKTAEKTAQKQQARYEEADRMYKNAVIGIAARFVKEGEPCPVCGSIHHPKIAGLSSEVLNEAELEILKGEMDRAKQVSSQCFQTALRLQGEYEKLIQTLQLMQQKKEQTEEYLQGFGEEIRSYTASAAKAEFEAMLEGLLLQQSKAEEKQQQMQDMEEEIAQKKQQVRLEREAFQASILQSGFASMQAYEAAVNGMEKLPLLEEEYAEYQEQLSNLKKLCEHLEMTLQGCEEKEEALLLEAFEKKQQTLQELRKQQQETHILLDQITRCLNGMEKNMSRAEAIHREYGIVKDLDDLANGNNPKRLVFEQYVLAGWFEQILRAANLRLFKMTDSRYELIRAKQVKDGRRKDNLEILVLDHYTGKERSVKTLSGGESFKAALALALGMSDCIQAQNGGMEVETLFIDEGFGALDEESVEQACEVLKSLAGNKRMIGIISHVTELREKVEQQIVVEKKNGGSIVRLQVQ